MNPDDAMTTIDALIILVGIVIAFAYGIYAMRERDDLSATETTEEEAQRLDESVREFER